MTVGRTERKLLAVTAAEVVGYARLMQEHEEDTPIRLMQLQSNVLEPRVAAHGGRIIRSTGDGFLAIFDSALDATQCCIEMQQTAARLASQEPVDQRIVFRFGIAIADTVIEEDDVYDGAVNMAARLQDYAEPGGIIVSGAVAEQVVGKSGISAVDLGEFQLKKLRRPIRAYKLCFEGGAAGLAAIPQPDTRPSIAVLPFRKNLVDPDDSYFADGMVEAIVDALASLKELLVISRASTLRYGGEAIDARAIGRELGVRYVL